MDETLIQNLNSAGAATEVIQLANGSQVLLLPRGGRVLGLFAGHNSPNFYWTNPTLNDATKTRAYFESDEWQNPGGDRMWLAPEIYFFFPKYPDLNVYHQPRQLDRQPYEFSRNDRGAGLKIEFDIKHARQEKPIRLRLSKSVENVVNPLRYESAWKQLKDVTFAGYGLHTSLEFISKPAQVPVGLWHLIQMPHGGDMLVPTYGPSEPKIVFGDIPTGDIAELASGGMRYRMTAKGEQKLSLRAARCTGRAAYLYGSGSTWQLVLRNFFVNPSGEYVDAPWTKPNDLGYGVQACNINGKWGIFSELEYHIPAIGVPGAPSSCEDFAQVWAYRGLREQIARIAQELLGVDINRA